MKIIFNRVQAVGALIVQRVSGCQAATLKRMVVAVLVGISLWSVSAPAQAADADDYYQNERGSLQTTERYDTIQPKTGDFNNFEDADPRRNTRAAEAKARTLSDTAERRKNMASDPLEPAREAISNAKGKVGEAVDDAVDSVRN